MFIIIIIIIMFLTGYAYFLFLDPQGEVGPSIFSSVVLCSFVLLVYILVLVLVVCLCPSSVHVVATFSGTVLFLLLCYSFIMLKLFFEKYSIITLKISARMWNFILLQNRHLHG